jgi:hypothetical protein
MVVVTNPMRFALPLLLGLALFPGLLAPAAQANQDAKINARIEAWGRNCKNAVAEKHPKATMAEISVVLGATLQQSINSGETTLKNIETQGLSFNWSFRKYNGYCNTDGNGTVTELN